MSQFSENPAVQECLRESTRCIGCGTCLASCPVYAQEPREELTARGRNRHIFDLLEAKGDEAKKDLFKCVLCGRCTMVCPRGIRNDIVVERLRELQVQRDGLPKAKGLVFRQLLSNRKTMAKAIRLAAQAQKLLPAEKGVAFGVAGDPAQPTVRHLPLFFSGLMKDRRLPSVADKFLSERLPEENPSTAAQKRKIRVAYFVGCATEFVLPASGEAIVRVLNEAGVDVVIPKEQGCCGLAVHVNGDIETSTAMALHNLEVLEKIDADYIITSCATCGSALRDIWPRMARNAEEKKRFEALAAKVRDASELILSFSYTEKFPYKPALPRGTTVTWHEPCHLGRHQHVSREPLTVLRRTFGEDFHALKETGCCGFGGSFNVYNYDLSKKIGSLKAENVRETGADYVISACPGCQIQLMDQMAQHGIPGRVIHLAEAITFRG